MKNLDVAAIDRLVRDLLAKGFRKEAQEEAGALLDYMPVDGLDLQRAANLLRDAGLTGPAQAIIERYVGLHPNEGWPRLLFIDSRIRAGLKKEAVQAIIADYIPQTLEEHLYLANCLNRIGMAGFAGSIYERALRSFPRSWQAWSGLIESYTNKNEYRAARAALRKLLPLNPEDAGSDYWATIAEQAGLAGERKVFAIAAAKAETLITPAEKDALPRLKLARAYGHLDDKASLVRVLRACDVGRLSSEWILSEILALAELKNLDEFQVPTARRILQLPDCRQELKSKCEAILEADRIRAASRFPWDKKPVLF